MELWSLRDRNRMMTGETMIRGDKIPEGRYHLVVHCACFSGDRMLIQKRQPFKRGWSGLWDITMGGSAVMGEDSSTAVQRELEEEVGIHHEFTGIPAMTVSFGRGFDDIWIIERDDIDITTLKLQESEVEKVAWATKDEILKMIEEKEFIPYTPAFIELLYHLKDHTGLHTRRDR
ncbi:MAG: NUDIX domain-containing protein [Clostridia bacterium]|nr:NUDIX domain-containing protein [Clostridia bacterium]